jgi:uncharacterized protein YjbK
MSQSLEIEFKNLLSPAEFENIKSHFGLEISDFIQQENHYFDTPSFLLKENKAALRIRRKANYYELTLKQTVEAGLLETTQIISESEAINACKEDILPKGHVCELIEKMKIDTSSLKFFGTLTTKRAELAYKDGLLVLDHSHYLHTEDYELEYEVTDRVKGEETFLSFLESFKIPIRVTDNKIMRFYRKKYQQHS